MIIFSQSPTRLSLFGGGTDISPYREMYGGLCINLSINIRQKITLSDNGNKNDFPPLANPQFYFQALKEFKVNDHMSIRSEYDGVLESGLGSSASAMVALIGAINKKEELGLTLYEIAEKAWEIEVNQLGLYGGKQDQYGAAFGGFNLFEFNKEKTAHMSYTRDLAEDILPHLLLFYLGVNRQSAKIQEGFKNITTGQMLALHKIKEVAEKAIKIIGQGDVEKIGNLLNEAWKFKKESNSGVSTPLIDKIYDLAFKSGAWGGKVMGAGGGGHMFFMCPREKRKKLIDNLAKEGIKEIDFGIDWNGLEARKL